MPQKNVDFVLIMCKDSFISPFELGRATQFWWELVFILAFGKPWQLLDCGPRLPWWNGEMIKPNRLWIQPSWKPLPAETLRGEGGLGGGWGADVPLSPRSLYSCSRRAASHGYSPKHQAMVGVCNPAGPLEEPWVEMIARIGPDSFSSYLLCHLWGGFSHTWLF